MTDEQGLRAPFDRYSLTVRQRKGRAELIRRGLGVEEPAEARPLCADGSKTRSARSVQTSGGFLFGSQIEVVDMSYDDNDKNPSAAFRFGRKFRDTVASARSAAADTIRGVADRAARKIEGPRATFEVAETKINLGVDVDADTLWATQQQIADLFEKDANTVGVHLANAYREKEISREATTSDFEVVRHEGGRQVKRTITHYNLDAILEVGRRTKSPRAAQFRAWSRQILKQYIIQGYALDERRLREDPIAAESLAERVRSIRYSEKHLYQRVRDCVAAVASDYDASSEHVRTFFMRMQDKFHWAACEQTAQDLLLSRADGSKERMGMTTQLNARPTLKDAEIAKNYLSEHELKLQMVAGDAFFAYVENMMLRNKSLTTAQLLAKIDDVFKFNEMPVFPGYRGYRGDQAKRHVKVQYDMFKARTAQERYNEARGLPPSQDG